MASIRPTVEGNWQAIIRRKGFPTKSRVFSKKALAERWARGEEKLIDEAISLTVAEKTSLSDLLAWYSAEFSVRKRAFRSESSCLRIVSAHLGHHSVAGLSANMIISYVDTRSKAGVGSDAIRKELNKLSVAIDAGMALRDIDIPANPVAKAKAILKVTKTLKPGVQRVRRPSADELQILYASHLGALIEFAVETAMRRGELANMQTDHVRGKTLLISQTKTDRPRRISLSPRALEILSNQPMAGDGTVWGLRPDSMSQAFSRICVSKNIVDLRFHDLRHEGTSRLFEQGLSINEVASITGHEDWKSLKRYTHLCPQALAERLV